MEKLKEVLIEKEERRVHERMKKLRRNFETRRSLRKQC